jgi:putative DNA primase/helicase
MEARMTSGKRKNPRLYWSINQYLERNEMGDAEMFAHLYTGEIVYDHADKKWFVRGKHFWEEDRTGKVKNKINQLAEIYDEYAENLKDKESPEYREAKRRHSCLLARQRIKNVLDLASNQPSIGLTGDEWDIPPLLLPVRNGVLDLSSGRLRDGRPNDYINTFSPTKWIGLDNRAPIWNKFIAEICSNDVEQISFLQRLLGYAITGAPREQVMPIFWGKGSNGKSVLMDTLNEVLGHTFCMPTPADPLMAAFAPSGDNARPFLYAMRNKRVVWASESQEGQRLNTGLVKQLTGDQNFTTRTLHSRPVTFTPSHTIVLVTNSLPELPDGSDYAMQRRLIVFPFNSRFVDYPTLPGEYHRDRDLPNKLRAEAPGILAWLVRGTRAWLREGLNPPESCKLVTKEYRESQDTVQKYITENLVAKDDHRIMASDIYSHYDKWCSENGLRAVSIAKFGRQMTDKYGHSKVMSLNGRSVKVYQGISFVP